MPKVIDIVRNVAPSLVGDAVNYITKNKGLNTVTGAGIVAASGLPTVVNALNDMAQAVDLTSVPSGAGTWQVIVLSVIASLRFMLYLGRKAVN